MKNRKARLSRGGVFLLIYALLALIAVIVGLVMVWFYADAYELSQPKNAMEDYIASLNTELWNDEIEKAIASMPHELQSNEQCRQAVQELLRGGITYSSSVGSGRQDEVVYSLRCGEGTIAKITAAPDKQNGKLVFGMYEYEIVREEYDFTGLYSPVQITVPSSFTVKLNGVTLGPESVTESVEYDALKPYYGVFADLPTKLTYRYDRAVGPLEFEVYDSRGEIFAIRADAGDEQFLTVYDEVEAAALSDFVDRFNTRYRTFISGVSDDPYAAYQRLAPYLKTGTELQRRLESAIDGLTWGHTYSISIDRCECTSLLSFGGGIYMCTFQTDFTTDSPAGTMRDSEEDMLFIQDIGGDLRVFAMDSK